MDDVAKKVDEALAVAIEELEEGHHEVYQDYRGHIAALAELRPFVKAALAEGERHFDAATEGAEPSDLCESFRALVKALSKEPG